MAALVFALIAALCLGPASAQPTNALAGQTPIVTNGVVLPDNTFVGSTWAQVAVGSAALQSYNDFDLFNFLVNTECLEAEFDSAATFGVPLDPLLQAGGPGAIGARRANISATLLPFLQETARDEAGHVRLIREALGSLASPCPLVDFTAFAQLMNNAFNRTFNPPFDPYLNDVNLVLAIWSLEEIGATGDKGVAVLTQNATLRDAAAGLAVSAGYQASTQRYILWERQNEIVQPLNVTVTQAMQAISDYRDSLDGPANVDQGLYYNGGINIVPTDGNGVTFSRTPQQVMSILTFGAPNGIGGFFPNGLNGRINLPTPLGVPVFGSTRPGTNYTAYSNTGFAAPQTNAVPSNVSFLPDPTPLTSAPPATLPATAAAVGAPVPNAPAPSTTTAPSPAATTPAATPIVAPPVISTTPTPTVSTTPAPTATTTSAPAPTTAPAPASNPAAAPASNPAAAPSGTSAGTTTPAPTSDNPSAPVANVTDGDATPAPTSTGRKMAL